jgi:site-specific DNA-methyltransferase (adenine-specific)
MSSDEGDIVLDPFVGTGTTAIAAKRLGRKFIGIDIDSEYVKIANGKIEEAEPTVINGCYVSNFLDNVITVRDKDWNRIKDAFFIPKDPIELEKREIHIMLHKTVRKGRCRITDSMQSDLFSLCRENK